MPASESVTDVVTTLREIANEIEDQALCISDVEYILREIALFHIQASVQVPVLKVN
jgi:hypothetical protein